MEAKYSPKIGEWLVHHQHGVGQLNGKKTMHIGGKESNYFRLEIENGTIFIPEDKMTYENFRPLSSRKTIAEMKEILSRPPKKMDKRYLTRTHQIHAVMSENSLLDIARLVRDLYGRRRVRTTLSVTENELLQKLRKRLVSEWAVVSGQDEMDIQHQMQEILVRHSR